MIGRIKRVTVCLACVIGMVSSVSAQRQDVAFSIPGFGLPQDVSSPVVWKAMAERVTPSKAVITLVAVINEGWHLYGFRMPDYGPRPTDIKFSLPEGVRLKGKLRPSRKVSRKFDAMFGSEVEFWTGKEVMFTQNLILDTGVGAVSVKCGISFMGCNDETCLPYRQLSLDINIPENSIRNKN